MELGAAHRIRGFAVQPQLLQTRKEKMLLVGAQDVELNGLGGFVA